MNETKNKATSIFEDERIGQDIQPLAIKGELWEAIKEASEEFPIKCSPEEFLTLCIVYGVDNVDDLYEHIY